MRAQLLTTVLAALAALACAKPDVTTTQSDHAVDVDAPPAVGSCSATRLREVRYGSTVARHTKLRPELASLRCVEDLDQKLEADIACAQAFNQANWEHALASRGLRPFAPAHVPVWLEGGGLEPGSIHPHPEDPSLRVVVLGYQSDSCSGTSVRTQVSPGIGLARNGAGEIVIVLPKPTIEQRDYARCSCFPGCGAHMESMPMFAVIPAGETVAGAVELVYDAIAIATHDVEHQSCCCAP